MYDFIRLPASEKMFTATKTRKNFLSKNEISNTPIGCLDFNIKIQRDKGTSSFPAINYLPNLIIMKCKLNIHIIVITKLQLYLFFVDFNRQIPHVLFRTASQQTITTTSYLIYPDY